MTGTPLVHEPSRLGWERHLGRDRSPAAIYRWLAAGTIPDSISAAAARAGDKVALEIDGRSVTHAGLDKWARTLAEWLGCLGVATGDRVLLALPNSLELVALYLAVLRLGAAVVFTAPALTSSGLSRLVADAEPVLGAAEGEACEVLSGAAQSSRPVPDWGYASGPVQALTVFSFPLDAPVAPVPRGTAVLAYTSGTTGIPKGAPLTHANLLASIRAAMAAWRWRADDTTVHCLPLFHQHGLGSVHATLLTGSRAVVRSRFDPEELARMFASERATILLGVPAMHRRLVASRPERACFRTLRLVVSGSAPLPPSLAEELAEVTGKVPLERYGTTESGLDVSQCYEGARRPGTVGLPLPGVEMRIVSPDGEEQGPGQDGEIVLRGPQVFAGYLGAGSGDPDAFTRDGWFRTGDIGRRASDDGCLEITGRLKELIITGGLNVYPREVELVLEAHPGVLGVMVAGVPSERWGEEVRAFVVPKPGSSPKLEELASWCRERLAPHQRPKRIELVESLTVDAMGKLQREATLNAALEHDRSTAVAEKGDSDGPRTG